MKSFFLVGGRNGSDLVGASYSNAVNLITPSQCLVLDTAQDIITNADPTIGATGICRSKLGILYFIYFSRT